MVPTASPAAPADRAPDDAAGARVAHGVQCSDWHWAGRPARRRAVGVVVRLVEANVELAPALRLMPLDRPNQVHEACGDPEAEADHREPRRRAEPAVEVVPACQTNDSSHDEGDAYGPEFTQCSVLCPTACRACRSQDVPEARSRPSSIVCFSVLQSATSAWASARRTPVRSEHASTRLERLESGRRQSVRRLSEQRGGSH